MGAAAAAHLTSPTSFVPALGGATAAAPSSAMWSARGRPTPTPMMSTLSRSRRCRFSTARGRVHGLAGAVRGSTVVLNQPWVFSCLVALPAADVCLRQGYSRWAGCPARRAAHVLEPRAGSCRPAAAPRAVPRTPCALQAQWGAVRGECAGVRAGRDQLRSGRVAAAAVEQAAQRREYLAGLLRGRVLHHVRQLHAARQRGQLQQDVVVHLPAAGPRALAHVMPCQPCAIFFLPFPSLNFFPGCQPQLHFPYT